VFASHADKSVVLGAGFDHVLRKSASPVELLDLLAELCNPDAPPRAA
jgi:hypothetical protein